MNAADISQLVENARDPRASLGEQHSAFTSLVQQSQHLVFSLALSRLRDVDEAKDATQDAFATAWRRLSQLREPAAFVAWLNSIVSSECSRRLRRRSRLTNIDPREVTATESRADRVDYQSVLASAIATLSEAERDVIVLYYYLGYSLPQIAKLLGQKPGTAGKRLHSARLHIRRKLPRSVRGDFIRVTPSAAFADRVRRGLLDEYVGVYRFRERPDHFVSIMTAGDTLVSESAGQRHVLLSSDEECLRTRDYDGEGHFSRNRRGEVTCFVYYEFGKRLGVAHKVRSRLRGKDSARFKS
jgi:RNA polymerase sigma-70 factor, ECF subfamily